MPRKWLYTAPDVTPAYLHEWVRWLIAPEQSNLRALIAEIHHAAMRDPEVRGLLGAYGSRSAAMIAEMVARWQQLGVVADDRDPRAVAQLFLTQALGLCTTGAFQPDVLRNRRVVALFDRHLAALLGEPDPVSYTHLTLPTNREV